MHGRLIRHTYIHLPLDIIDAAQPRRASQDGLGHSVLINFMLGIVLILSDWNFHHKKDLFPFY